MLKYMTRFLLYSDLYVQNYENRTDALVGCICLIVSPAFNNTNMDG